MLIGFLICVAAGYFLQPYVMKIRLPRFRATHELSVLRVELERKNVALLEAADALDKASQSFNRLKSEGAYRRSLSSFMP